MPKLTTLLKVYWQVGTSWKNVNGLNIWLRNSAAYFFKQQQKYLKFRIKWVHMPKMPRQLTKRQPAEWQSAIKYNFPTDSMKNGQIPKSQHPKSQAPKSQPVPSGHLMFCLAFGWLLVDFIISHSTGPNSIKICRATLQFVTIGFKSLN